MSDITVLSRPQRRSTIESIVLDATLSAEHSLESDVTQFPVEDGANISDHIWPKPRRFKIEGEITNSPLVIFGPTQSSNGDGDSFLNSRRNAAGAQTNFVQIAYKALKQLHADRQLITISCGLDTYTNMAIESVLIPQAPTDGDAIHFTMSVIEVIKVSSQVIAIQIKSPKKPSAIPKANKGPQTASTAPAAAAVQTSILKATLKGLIGIFKTPADSTVTP